MMQIATALLPVLNVSPSAPPGISAKISTLLGYLAWGGGAACVAALIVGGIIILLGAMGRMDGAERVVRVIGAVFLGSALIASAGALGAVLVPGV